jgi:hypothetical protein
MLRLSDVTIPVKNLNSASPADLPCLVPRLPCASFRKTCPTASGRQGRGCAELHRSKSILKRCASCGSKGTFDFRLSFFSGKSLMRILRRTSPPGRQGGQSAALAPLCSVTQSLDRQSDPATLWVPSGHNESLSITVRRKPSPPDTGAPKVYGRTDGDRFTPRFVTACFLPPSLKPSVCVSGNRGNST